MGRTVSRVPAAPADAVTDQFGPEAPLRHQVYANAPALARTYVAWQGVLRADTTLPARLVELVRLRIAFHNQCRSCMSVRYGDALAEGAVCSLEAPQQAADLSAAEKAALAYADLLATNHLEIDDAVFARLAEHFTPTEIMALCFHAGTYVGYGRMGASLAMVDDLGVDYQDLDRPLAPWAVAPVSTL